MGYTHFFKDLCVTDELAAFAQRAVNLSNVSICGGMGEGDPVITSKKIWINGDESKGEDCETFGIFDHPAEWVYFCKTERCPYDKVVTAILLAAMKLKAPGEENICSDGNIEDWIESGGVELYIETFNSIYPGETPITTDFANKISERIGGDPHDLLNLQEDALYCDKPKLSKKVSTILEDHGWSIYFPGAPDEGLVELENHSPAGEDLIVNLPVRNFEKEVAIYAENFDPEEHVEMLLEAKKHGLAGVPSLFTLVDDSREIKEMLTILADALNGKKIEKESLHDETSWMIRSDDIEEELNTNERFSKVPELSKNELQEIAENADDLLRGDDDVMQKTFDYIDESLSDFLREHYPEAIDDSEDDEEDNEE